MKAKLSALISPIDERLEIPEWESSHTSIN